MGDVVLWISVTRIRLLVDDLFAYSSHQLRKLAVCSPCTVTALPGQEYINWGDAPAFADYPQLPVLASHHRQLAEVHTDFNLLSMCQNHPLSRSFYAHQCWLSYFCYVEINLHKTKLQNYSHGGEGAYLPEGRAYTCRSRKCKQRRKSLPPI